MSRFLSVIPVEKARSVLLGMARKTGEKRVPLIGSAGYVLRTDIISDVDIPGFDRSAVDGYALVARTESGEVDKRVLLIRVDQEGEILWENSYLGGSVASLQPTYDGGYIMAGRVDSDEGKKDALVIKADSSGAEQWSKRLGGRGEDIGTYALQSRDGSFLLAGITGSFGQGREDAWLVKLAGDAAIESHPQSNLSFSLYPLSSALPLKS